MRKNDSIPVNTMTGESGAGISIERITLNDFPTADTPTLIGFEEEAKQSHRHDRHSFFLLESGIVSIEIDFQHYKIQSPSVVYMHPNQVHRTTAFKM